MERYRARNSSMRWVRIALMTSFVNVSDVTYMIWRFGFSSSALCPIAWSRCVLPRPTPPCTKNGLYCVPGCSAMFIAAAWARRLELPTT